MLNRKRIIVIVLVVVCQIISLGSAFNFVHINAQAQQFFSQPVNVSRSGAASQPRIVTSPDGQLQVFWWDRFDGIMTAVYDGVEWSEPGRAPILSSNTQLPTPSNMPRIVADANGNIHAFWAGQTDPKFQANSLLYSSMSFGSTEWSPVEIVAESALAYSVVTPNSGDISIAYIRPLENDNALSGAYIRRMASNSGTWGQASPIYNSVYYRLLTPGSTSISLVDNGDGYLQVVWQDPIEGKSFYAASFDEGQSWSLPEQVGSQEQGTFDPRLANFGGDTLRIWQVSTLGSCGLLQQEQLLPSSIPITSTEPVTIPQVSSAIWSNTHQIMNELSNCPTGENFFQTSDGQGLIWLWGEGTAELNMAAWDIKQNQWSNPASIGVQFQDTESGAQIALSDLHESEYRGGLAVSGVDPNGEIWVSQTQISNIELIYSPAPPWSNVQSYITDGQPVDPPAMSMDNNMQTHLVWSQAAIVDVGSSALFYTQWNSNSTSVSQDETTLASQTSIAPIKIFDTPGEFIRQPSIVSDQQNRLHLVWSGGQTGEIFYSRSEISQAASPSGWLPAVQVSQLAPAGWPQIGVDKYGFLYVAYLITVNEERGVYLVKSEDGGTNWSQPIRVFDATSTKDNVGEDWPRLDHLSMAIGPDQRLHLSWVNASLPEGQITRGIYYINSPDGGKTWIKPYAIAEKGSDWPKIVLSNGFVHLIYGQVSSRGDGQLWHRLIPLDQAALDIAGWETAEPISDWETILLPFGVAVDGLPDQILNNSGEIHLTGLDPVNNVLQYAYWQNGRWSKTEKLLQPNTQAQVTSLSSSTRPEGGELAVAWLSKQQSGGSWQTLLSFSNRVIPTTELQTPLTVEPTATPNALPTPTEAILVVVTPTPNLNRIPAPVQSPVSPMVIGGVLAAIIIAIFFGGQLMRGRNR